MTPLTVSSSAGSTQMTVLTMFSRFRNDLLVWWEKRSYHPEKRYMRGARDA